MLPSRLDEWLDFIAQQHSRSIDMGLERAARVLRRMQLDRTALGTVVTIGGTNGKGSSLASLEHLLMAQGAVVVSYTSPHLLRYNERVRINGVDADDALLCEAFAQVEQARQGESLTYFEFGTLAALFCFARQRPDYCLLEVGLGGRLDAVNLIDADLAVVTSIGIDHVDWLGPDRESIAREKAGILRAGRSWVCGEPDPPRALRTVSDQLGCRPFWREQDFRVLESDSQCWEWQGLSSDRREVKRSDLPLTSVPVANVATALQALAVLDRLPSAEALRVWLPRIRVKGRFETLRQRPRLVVDVGHNPHAASYLRERLRLEGGRWNAVFSALADKDIESILQIMADVIDQWYCAPLDVERAANRERLQSACASANLTNVTWSKSPADAIRMALKESAPDQSVLVFGSFYTVAEALSMAEHQPAMQVH